MNRAERRRMEKQRAARGLQKVITQQIIQEVENDRVEALMMCFVLALHEERLAGAAAGMMWNFREQACASFRRR